MLTEHGGWGRRGRGRVGSQVGRLNDSHVTKPSQTVRVCLQCMHYSYTFLFLMISALFTNSCVQSTNMFQT